MDVKKKWNSSWQKSLKTALPALIQKGKVVALVGIGHPLKGDDAAGLAVIHRLKNASLPKNLFIYDSGAVPENCTGVLRKILPALVIFVDAADMGMDPGDVALFDSEQVDQVSGITHSLPFGVLVQYIKAEIGCDIWVLGIQPAQNEMLAPMSNVVQVAVERIVDFFKEIEKP